MKRPCHTVAVLAATPALTSILASVLDADPALRVRAFSDPQELRTYMRVVAVDLVVLDFDCEAAPAESLAVLLRSDTTLASAHFRIIALSRNIRTSIRAAALRAGMDEVIVKPMSPKHLLERVRVRLGAATPVRLPAAAVYLDPIDQPEVQIDIAAYGGKVVPLFPRLARQSLSETVRH